MTHILLLSFHMICLLVCSVKSSCIFIWVTENNIVVDCVVGANVCVLERGSLVW